MDVDTKRVIYNIALETRNKHCAGGSSRDMCHIVSKDLEQVLSTLGFDAKIIHCHVDIGEHGGRNLSISHYYVQVNDKFLDATLDQFSNDRKHYIPPVYFGKRPSYVRPNSIYAI